MNIVDECSILLAPTILLCHQSNCLGSQAFPVAAAQLWNILPDDIVLADSLSTCRLIRYLFQQSYPDVVL